MSGRLVSTFSSRNKVPFHADITAGIETYLRTLHGECINSCKCLFFLRLGLIVDVSVGSDECNLCADEQKEETRVAGSIFRHPTAKLMHGHLRNTNALTDSRFFAHRHRQRMQRLKPRKGAQTTPLCISQLILETFFCAVLLSSLDCTVLFHLHQPEPIKIMECKCSYRLSRNQNQRVWFLKHGSLAEFVSIVEKFIHSDV